MKIDWFDSEKYFFLLINQWKLTDLTVKIIFFTDESVKRQITDSISENLTDSDLESMYTINSKKYTKRTNKYVTNSIAYWFESMIYMLLERNAFDSIAFFSQCTLTTHIQQKMSK